MSKGPERKIEEAAVKYANKLGIRTIRMYFGPGIQTGWPDELFLIPGGRPLFIEFKAPGEEPTKKQERKLQILEKDGYNAVWADNLFQAKRIIFNAYAKARKE